MLEPMTTKTKNPSITGPTLKSFFFALPESTKPRRWMFPWNFRDLCAIMRCESSLRARDPSSVSIHREIERDRDAIAARARATRVRTARDASRDVFSTHHLRSERFRARTRGSRARRRVRARCEGVEPRREHAAARPGISGHRTVRRRREGTTAVSLPSFVENGEVWLHASAISTRRRKTS